MTTPNPLLSEDEKTLDTALTMGFLYGIQSDMLPAEEVAHRVATWKHTQGFKESKQAIKNLLVEARIDEFSISNGIWSQATEVGTKSQALKVRQDLLSRQEELLQLKSQLSEEK